MPLLVSRSPVSELLLVARRATNAEPPPTSAGDRQIPGPACKAWPGRIGPIGDLPCTSAWSRPCTATPPPVGALGSPPFHTHAIPECTAALPRAQQGGFSLISFAPLPFLATLLTGPLPSNSASSQNTKHSSPPPLPFLPCTWLLQEPENVDIGAARRWDTHRHMQRCPSCSLSGLSFLPWCQEQRGIPPHPPLPSPPRAFVFFATLQQPTVAPTCTSAQGHAFILLGVLTHSQACQSPSSGWSENWSTTPSRAISCNLVLCHFQMSGAHLPPRCSSRRNIRTGAVGCSSDTCCCCITFQQTPFTKWLA